MSEYKVSGRVITRCNRCKMDLAHTIVAIVGNDIKRVQCNTCGSPHNFNYSRKKNEDDEDKPKTILKPTRREMPIPLGAWSRKLDGRDYSTAKNYSPKEKFVQNDLINHPTFGMGVVEKVLDNKKVEVLFQSGLKILICNM